ncbi:hypothetical protein QTI51_10845 [Variovorax sp. J22G73]|uniref:hypothetical protein n=1 Tax=unclassified Variovorax TaxID=663243 RepID=UPI00104B242B|nr:MULTISPECIES: hypothetical protein [unclassified Variovorax]MDM0006203.1 hypothetical protein [Variovorax sp. J22R203]MDM0097774.1 hypothetical protein [Variovorax sp. J22G73]
MESPLDTRATAQFFTDISERFEAILLGFSTFRDRLQAVGETNPYFKWQVSGLTENRRSFEVRYLDLTVRAVLSVQPHIDLLGVITFYRLDDFDPLQISKVDSVEFDAETGRTGIKHTAGTDLYINVPQHAAGLLTAVLQTAYVARG